MAELTDNAIQLFITFALGVYSAFLAVRKKSRSRVILTLLTVRIIQRR